MKKFSNTFFSSRKLHYILITYDAIISGPVNTLLSSRIMAPISRLTYMTYLVHPLVIWCKIGSFRERPAAWHYDFVSIWLRYLLVKCYFNTDNFSRCFKIVMISLHLDHFLTFVDALRQGCVILRGHFSQAKKSAP